MEKYELEESAITKENVEKMIVNTFWKIKELSNQVDSKGWEILCECLDGSPSQDIIGVQLLMSDLNGSGYSLVTDPETGKRDYVKKTPQDPKVVYNKLNDLIDFVNSVVQKHKKSPGR